MEVMFPYQLMANETRFSIIGQSLATQQGLSGVETVVPAFGARWRATVNYVVLGRAAQLALAAFLAGMEGRLGTTLVPLRARYRPHDRDGHGVTQCLTAGLSDAETREHFGLVAAPVATCTVLLGAAVRATQITFAWGDTTGLRPGQMFTIGERAYRAQLVWEDGLGRQVAQFQPPLRQAVVPGDVMVLDAVQCRMRLDGDYEDVLADLGQAMQRLSLTFVEAI